MDLALSEPFLPRQSGDAADSCLPKSRIIGKIVAFFAVNVLAHVLSMPGWPGQTLKIKLLRSFCMVTNPTMAVNPVMAQFWAYCKARWMKRGTGDVDKVSVWGRLKCSWRGHSKDDWRLQHAVRSGAVAVEGHGGEFAKWTDLTHTPRKLLRYDATMVSDKSDIKLVPSDAIIISKLQFPPASSWVSNVVAVAQLCYSSFELWADDKQALAQLGLSAPVIIVIPYAVGSLLNLVFNLFIPTYGYIMVVPDHHNLIQFQQFQVSDDIPKTRSRTDDEATCTLMSSTGSIESVQRSSDKLSRYGTNHFAPFVGKRVESWAISAFNAFLGGAVISSILFSITPVRLVNIRRASIYLCWIYFDLTQFLVFDAVFLLLFTVLFVPALVMRILKGCWNKRVQNWQNRLVDAFRWWRALRQYSHDLDGGHGKIKWKLLAVGRILPLLVFALAAYTAGTELWESYSMCPPGFGSSS